MGARKLLIVSISTGLVLWSDAGLAAQDEETNVQNLPAVEVAAPQRTTRRPAPRTPVRVVSSGKPKNRIYVYPTAPGNAKGLDVDKVPSSISAIDASQIKRTGSMNVSDALRDNVANVNITEVSGNPFQPNVEFRGFVASPIVGTPQGLAVYQNGVRVNEAFADSVNWDLIPTAAIRSVTVVTNNPAFGLNALGGAVNLQMKDGFSYQGAETDTMGGSFGRIQSSAQWGKQVDANYAVYAALEGLHDNGFRNLSQSDVRRFYGDVGYRGGDSEFHVNMGLADDDFGATATVPAELLQQYWGAVYTSPQTTNNRVGHVNLTGKVEATPAWTFEATAHARVFEQRVVDGNPSSVQECAAAGLLCFGDNTTPANGLNGAQLANPFASGSLLGELDRTYTRSTTFGVSGQATNTDELFDHENRFLLGASFDASVTRFNASAELGTIGTDYVVSGSGVFLGQSGTPATGEMGPVSLRTVNQYTGLYALDTFNVSDAFAITGGGRFNHARVTLEDQLGTALNGDHAYDRFNPVIGGTYKITPELTAYAGYSEANRVPTPLELGCADPNNPCLIASFLVSDPPLKQVVSKTVEAGLRGTKELNIGTLGWKIGGFRATNHDDIMGLPVAGRQGFGFFQNVGATRRQGLEAEVNLKSDRLQFHASYALVDARFLDALELSSNSPFADPGTGTIQVVAGNQIPAVPRHRIKAGIEYAATDAWKVGGDALWVSSQYLVGDESNQASKLPSYAVFNLHTSYQFTKNVQLYGKVDNIFDNRYASYGTFFDTTAVPNFANSGNPFTDPRSLSPARPRAFYAGMRVTF
ncbi:TonB-dependent receptor [Bradyrhizobium sp. Gha]|uniref:TonB-dependent receptor n=1 Tax=Bradyrhizobium sp. Gha TaxID=1855318 RepID=UPI0008E8EAAC|nr:TonB-dependent receptor [Bradyrhizobium sp. Gha]SFI45488.1 Outer membrane receptor proteins, mostly Fe transport [Bradyrhizobium sp. Gha]